MNYVPTSGSDTSRSQALLWRFGRGFLDTCRRRLFQRCGTATRLPFRGAWRLRLFFFTCPRYPFRCFYRRISTCALHSMLHLSHSLTLPAALGLFAAPPAGPNAAFLAIPALMLHAHARGLRVGRNMDGNAHYASHKPPPLQGRRTQHLDAPDAAG